MSHPAPSCFWSETYRAYVAKSGGPAAVNMPVESSARHRDENGRSGGVPRFEHGSRRCSFVADIRPQGRIGWARRPGDEFEIPSTREVTVPSDRGTVGGQEW